MGKVRGWESRTGADRSEQGAVTATLRSTTGQAQRMVPGPVPVSVPQLATAVLHTPHWLSEAVTMCERLVSRPHAIESSAHMIGTVRLAAARV